MGTVPFLHGKMGMSIFPMHRARRQDFLTGVYTWERAHQDYGDDEAGPDPESDPRGDADRA